MSPDQQAKILFERYHEYMMARYPEWATYIGDHRYDDKLSDMSIEAHKRDIDTLKMYLQQADSLHLSELSDTNKVNIELFKTLLQNAVTESTFETYLMPLSQQSGIHIDFPQIIETQPLNTTVEYDRYIKRLEAFPLQVDATIDRMKLGMDKGIVPPDFIINQIIDQLANILNEPVDKTPFTQPILKGKHQLSESEVVLYKDKIFDQVTNKVLPAYNSLAKFIKNEYLPKARKGAGIWDIPNGEAYYTFQIKNQTTVSLTPDAIFQTGLNEVSRIRNEMEKTREEMGFKGDMTAFIQSLRTNPEYYYTNKDSLLADYAEILKKMDDQLGNFFNVLPKAKYAIKEMETYRAQSAPQAYYYPPPLDGSRPGYFYVNTYNLKSRPKYTMTALALHEAVPGHHTQIALAQEIEAMPWFRKDYNATGFVEGWALYAEYLGYEANMYEDPQQRLGALLFEMWRACRLVVDIGLHQKHWDRNQAVNFMLENTANSELDIRSEIDRYISIPGQALAYKIGELKIKELRKNAEQELGDKFDIKDFHNTVLEQGAIPLELLETRIHNWIHKTKGIQQT